MVGSATHRWCVGGSGCSRVAVTRGRVGGELEQAVGVVVFWGGDLRPLGHRVDAGAARRCTALQPVTGGGVRQHYVKLLRQLRDVVVQTLQDQRLVKSGGGGRHMLVLMLRELSQQGWF